MNARLLSAALLAVLACLCCLSVPRTALAAEQVDTSYIPSDAVMCFVVRPAQIAKYPTSNPADVEFVLKKLADEGGIDLTLLNEVVFCFGHTHYWEKTEHSDPGDLMSFVFRFSEKIDGEKIIEKMSFGGLERVKEGGIEYYRSGYERGPSLAFPDDKTMVFAPLPRLKKILVEKHTMNPIDSRLRRTAADFDFVAVAAVAGHRDVFEEVFGEMPLGEIPLDGGVSVKSIIERIDAVTITARLSDDVPASIEIEARDEAAAKSLAELGEKGLALAKEMFPLMRKEILDAPPSKELGAAAVKLIKTVIDGTRIKSEEERVFISLESQGGATVVVDVVAGAWAAMYRAFDSFEGAPPAVEEAPADAIDEAPAAP